MYRVYASGGVLLGFGATLAKAQELLLSTAVGWISVNGKIVEKKGF